MDRTEREEKSLETNILCHTSKSIYSETKRSRVRNIGLWSLHVWQVVAALDLLCQDGRCSPTVPWCWVNAIYTKYRVYFCSQIPFVQVTKV